MSDTPAWFRLQAAPDAGASMAAGAAPGDSESSEVPPVANEPVDERAFVRAAVVMAETDATGLSVGSEPAWVEAGSSRPSTPDDQFRDDAVAALGRFREAMERVVYSVTRSLQNSRDLHVALGVDRNVSWQLFKLLGPIETLATAPYVPAGVSLKKVLTLAKKRGAAAADLAAASVAFAELEQFIASTSSDREGFETMVMSYSESPEAAQVDLQHRKAAFRADSHLFGVKAETSVIALLYHPGDAPDTCDFVAARQLLGLRRLRSSTDVVIDRWKVNRTFENWQDRKHVLGDALDADAATAHNAAILPEFCSLPLLPMETVTDEAGDVRTLLRHREGGVGRESDLAISRVYRNTLLGRTPDGRPVIEGLIEIARPTRLQVIDTLVHRPTWPHFVPSSGVYAHLSRRDVHHLDQVGVRLTCADNLTFLGGGTDLLRMPEAPRYPDMVRHVCLKMGWRFEDMDVYRFRMDYPLMDSNVHCRLEAISVP